MKKIILLTSILALAACGGGSGGGYHGGSINNGNGDITNNEDTNIGGDNNENTGGDNNENTGGNNNENAGGDNDEPDLPPIIAPELFSGNLHMFPKVTNGGEGSIETYYLIANPDTGAVVMRTYLSECQEEQGCESDSHGFIKNEFEITNLNDFTDGVHENGLTAFLNEADNIGMQYSDIFTSKDPNLSEDGLPFFEPMYYDGNVVDMNAIAASLTENVEYQGKAYGTIRTEQAQIGVTNDAQVTDSHSMATINAQGDPIGTDATLTFNPNNGNPIETLNADFSAFNWYDTTITVQNGNITDVQLTAKGDIASGFAVDNGGADTIESSEAHTVYSGGDTNAVATEAVGSYHIEWTRPEGDNSIDTLVDITFGGVKQ